MTYYSVNPGGVTDIGAQMKAATNELINLIDEVERMARETMVSWSGVAADAFVVAEAEWDKGAQGMADLANVRNAKLDRIVNDYVDTDINCGKRIANS
jgi:WXG100 family type VII secretion target